MEDGGVNPPEPRVIPGAGAGTNHHGLLGVYQVVTSRYGTVPHHMLGMAIVNDIALLTRWVASTIREEEPC